MIQKRLKTTVLEVLVVLRNNGAKIFGFCFISTDDWVKMCCSFLKKFASELQKLVITYTLVQGCPALSPFSTCGERQFKCGNRRYKSKKMLFL
jgi:hypothetical protein